MDFDHASKIAKALIKPRQTFQSRKMIQSRVNIFRSCMNVFFYLEIIQKRFFLQFCVPLIREGKQFYNSEISLQHVIR